MSKAIGNIFLDTNAVIAYLAGDELAAAWIESADELWMNVVCRGELLYGALRSSNSEKNLRQLSIFETQCSLVDCSLDTAWWYAHIRAELAKSGKPIPEADIWIAASCVQYKIPLLTADEHFRAVTLLTRFDWRRPVGKPTRRNKRK